MAVGALGAWVTAGYFAAGSIAAGMIGGAIVGAVVGGLMAAVTGGNILKGVLFGAIGGAVVGGVSAWAAGGSWAGGAPSSGMDQSLGMVQSGQEVAKDVTMNVTQSTSDTLSELGKSMAMSSGKDIIGSFLEKGAEGYLAAEGQEAAMEAQSREAELAHEREMEKLQFAADNRSGGGGSDSARLQYDLGMSQLAQRKEEFDTQTEQVRKEWDTEKEREAGRTALFAGGGKRLKEASAPTGGSSIQEKRALRGIDQITPEEPTEEVA